MENLRDVILDKIEGQVKQNMERETPVHYTTTNVFVLQQQLKKEGNEVSVKEINGAINELIKDKKLFFNKEISKSANLDGTLRQEEKTRFFIDKDKAMEFILEKQNKKAKEVDKELEKMLSLKDLSDSAKLIYGVFKEQLEVVIKIDDKTKERAFVENGDLQKSTNLTYQVFNEALKELKDNKLLFLTVLDRESENPKFVLTNEQKYAIELSNKDKEKNKEVEKSTKETPKKEEELER